MYLLHASKAKSAETTMSSDEIHYPPGFSLADVVAWGSYGLIVVEDWLEIFHANMTALSSIRTCANLGSRGIAKES